MPHFPLRLCLLDYPAVAMGDPRIKALLSDLVEARQLEFSKASDTFIATSTLDMVSTHVLVYDTRDFLNPRLVAGMRTCYEDRTRKHHLTLPCDHYIPLSTQECREAFQLFRKRQGPIVDSNAWFVRFTKTRLSISNILLFASVLFILRKGYGHFMGAVNERFHGSRFIRPIGTYQDGLFLDYPFVPGRHKLIMIDEFSREWLKQCFAEYSGIIEEAFEVVPCVQGEILESLASVRERILSGASLTRTTG